MQEREPNRHKVTLSDREVLEIDGVINVEKFTDEEILLETQLGMLDIKGEKMFMKQLNLDGGVVSIEGNIKSLAYFEGTSSKQKAKGIMNRLFR